jgi:hypothetical protein
MMFHRIPEFRDPLPHRLEEVYLLEEGFRLEGDYLREEDYPQVEEILRAEVERKQLKVILLRG